MWKYIIKRLLAMIPTLFGICLLSFVIINMAPGGPIEQRIQQIRFAGAAGMGGRGSTEALANSQSGVSQDVIDALKKQYGFDKPLLVRFGIWMKNVATLNFGNSFTYDEPVMKVIISKFPVSLQFGIASLILTYLIC